MKSLSISTATAAVAISLASSASANETRPYVMPELDTMLFAESPSALASVDAPASASETIAPVAQEQVAPISEQETSELPSVETTAPEALLEASLALNSPEGLLNLPASRGSMDADAPFYTASLNDANVVTTMSLSPNYGDIDAFWGDIVAFYGDIDAFWGDISPFYGDIDAFWGDISPFYGDIGAFWGDIVAFDQANLQSIAQFGQNYSSQLAAVESQFDNIRYYEDGSIIRDGTPDKMMAALAQLISLGKTQFGSKYTAKTGRNFDQLVNEVFARHGADANNKATIEVLTKGQRAELYLDFHDTLNQYSGIDAVDHWMSAINWTPSVTQIQGEGRQTIIGIVDGSFSTDADLGDNVVWTGGSNIGVGGHGASVASLIAGAHDGEGVMGIAPKVKIAAYNPFGADNTASWSDVETAIGELMWAYVGGNETGYVSIVNLSLGESGWTFSQGMADVLGSARIAPYLNETTYVIAAGNDGISQTADINWAKDLDPAFILVGSVDPNGQISNFSNRPGSACLLKNGVCNAGDELFMRTVVAPGSMLLASDGQGGVTRVSGTSFAAPLVSGAVSLLHDRWPWLVRNPDASAEIIFRSAKDLGAPGPDEVYGWGLLDVTASQSPLDFGQLNISMYQGNGAAQTVSATSLLASGIPSWWETEGVYFTAFENVGNTYRDFTIPMSSLKYGTSSNVLGNGYKRMQDFISDRFANWLLSGGTDKDGDGTLGVSQVRSNVAETSGQWSMRFDALAPQFSDDGAMRNVHSAATLSNPAGNMSFTLGHGQGALALAGNNFGVISDHDQDTGGVNPVLGFASGETFAGATYSPAKGTTFSAGYSQNREDWRDLNGVSEIERNVQRQLGAREAQALTFAVEQKISKNFSVNAQYTYLRENDAVLGAQTGSDALLGEGARTNAVTVSASMDLGDGFSFDLSATGGATQTAQGQLLATSGDVMSTAGQFTVNKRGVMGARDVLRVSVGQPLTVERGELELRSEQVVDRLTGERGIVTQTIGIDTKRRYTGEIVYATPVTKTSELGVVGRYISAGELGQDESFMIGANFGLRF